MTKRSNQTTKLLTQILKATGWSQNELAMKLGVSFPTLNSWVNGKSEPREKALEKINLIATEVLGADEVDKTELSELKAKALKNKYSVTKLLNNREVLDRITLNLTYHSNATEGSTMTESDVAAVIFDNKILRNRTNIEQLETTNHKTALYFLLDELKAAGENFQLSADLIRATHLRMTNGIISDAGYFRQHGARIQGAYVPLVNPLKIPELIENWCNLANSETTDPIALLAEAHANFEKIHPFSDGNGRTGRLLLFILALKLGLVPPILPKDRRQAYYKYLELAQMKNLNDPLELYIAESIIGTARMLEE